jgi:starch phosphorylase
MVHSAIYPNELTGRTIRLLTVEPGDAETPLRCKLSETCLDASSLPYHALSYCWGANHSPIQITCNAYPLLVTPNLHSVLLEYRRRGTSIPLWVDAICINQSNISERTSQVRMMNQIYSEAECVVVWLGGAEETDGLALELLKEIYKPWAGSTDITILETGQDALAYDAYLSPRVPQAYFNALAAFLSRPWFSRIWMYVSYPSFSLTCSSESWLM